MARSAAELEELESLELVGPAAISVALESSVEVAVAVDEVRAALPVAVTELVEAYWLARAQNWVTWPLAEDARGSLGQLL